MRKERSRIVKTIRKLMPAIVTIVIKKSLEELKKEFKAEQTNNSKSKSHHLFPFEIPKEKIDAHGMVQVDGGSGFFVDKNGTILTNKHVIVETNAEYEIITNENERYEAEILARDPVNDIAILKVKSEKKFPSVKLGDSAEVELGQTVLAFGNALGMFKNTVSQGIVSGISRSLTAHTESKKSPVQEMRGLIQTDAAINPGNSGGPLTNIYGEVIGINAAIIAGAQNICFAIPINSASRDLKDLRKYGKIKRPLLGLHYLIITDDMKEKMNLPINYGALVTNEHPVDKAVLPDGPAYNAGIKNGDIILTWNGKKITQEKTILDMLETQNINDLVNLKFLRDEVELETSVKLGERK